MTQQRIQQAAPPDDGHLGAYTEPEQTLLAEPGNTESIEATGTQPFKRGHENRGLMLFWMVIAIVSVGGALAAYLHVLPT